MKIGWNSSLPTSSCLKQEFPTLTIITMSGGGRKGNFNFLEMAEVLGADRAFSKPFEQQEMRSDPGIAYLNLPTMRKSVVCPMEEFFRTSSKKY